MTYIRNFWKDEQGQDLVESVLLIGFCALAAITLFLGFANSANGVSNRLGRYLATAEIPTSEAIRMHENPFLIITLWLGAGVVLVILLAYRWNKHL